jgi:hypothetical protein
MGQLVQYQLVWISIGNLSRTERSTRAVLLIEAREMRATTIPQRRPVHWPAGRRLLSPHRKRRRLTSPGCALTLCKGFQMPRADSAVAVHASNKTRGPMESRRRQNARSVPRPRPSQDRRMSHFPASSDATIWDIQSSCSNAGRPASSTACSAPVTRTCVQLPCNSRAATV